MRAIIKTYYKIFVFFIVSISFLSCKNDVNHQSEAIKVSLRNVGHQLLLSNQDSTTIVKPIRNISESKYQLKFDSDLAIHPDSLVTIIKQNFEKANLPSFYLVEVLRCNDREVAYSYEMKQNIENGIIPCGGRQLKSGCYIITLRFTKTTSNNGTPIMIWILMLFPVVVLAGVYIYIKKRKPISKDEDFATIGHFKFYPEQNKLIKEAIEINLSKKECEILNILVSQVNQVVKREELTKRVWEDNGVVVGRSLDTYISKLRKKLQEDDSVKLVNVHGVGYKLELKE